LRTSSAIFKYRFKDKVKAVLFLKIDDHQDTPLFKAVKHRLLSGMNRMIYRGHLKKKFSTGKYLLENQRSVPLVSPNSMRIKKKKLTIHET